MDTHQATSLFGLPAVGEQLRGTVVHNPDRITLQLTGGKREAQGTYKQVQKVGMKCPEQYLME